MLIEIISVHYSERRTGGGECMNASEKYTLMIIR